jgi:hypothetical protein
MDRTSSGAAPRAIHPSDAGESPGATSGPVPRSDGTEVHPTARGAGIEPDAQIEHDVETTRDVKATRAGGQAARADEARAEETRRRLRSQGIIPIEPEPSLGLLGEPGERVLALRHAVALDRRQPRATPPTGIEGDLYVTTHRVIHIGRQPVVFELRDIVDALIIGERLVIVAADGYSVSLDVHDPRSLRVEIAAARAARKLGGGG